jgi:RNA recognition motif-containing protein
MENTDHAINAIQALNGMEVNGRCLDVKIASPKGNRPPKKEAAPKKMFQKKPFDKKPFNRDSNRTGDQERSTYVSSERPQRRFDK